MAPTYLPPSLTGLTRTPAGTQIDLEQDAQADSDQEFNDLVSNDVGDPFQNLNLQNNARNALTIRQPGGMTPWLQAIKNAGVSKLRGGPSPAGSNQITGLAAQPASDLPSTMFEPGQSSAVTGETYEQAQQRLQQAAAGLGKHPRVR